MNILLGPVNKENLHIKGISYYLDFEKLNSKNHNVKSFRTLLQDDDGIKLKPDYKSILNSNENFVPDLLIIFHPEYIYLPNDISEIKCPIVTIFMDWNLSSPDYILSIANISDWIFTDEKGVEFFKNQGFQNVSTLLTCCYSPTFFKDSNTYEKEFDITFVGNLDNSVHNHREKYLYKLLDLNEKYNVKIESGIFNEDYIKFLKQSKISFNHSIKGEVNMRTFEVMIAKSLLLVEEDNENIKKYFLPDIHYISYNEENLFEKIDYYIENEEDRNKIIENAYIEAQKYSYENVLLNLFDNIQEMNLKRNSGKPLLIKYLNSENQELSLITEKIYDSVKMTPFLYMEHKNICQAYNNLGVIYFNYANKAGEEKVKFLQVGQKQFNKSLDINKDYIPARINNALFYLTLKSYKQAEKEALLASFSLKKISELNEENKGMINLFFNPYFRVKWIKTIFDSNENIVRKKYLMAIVEQILGDIEFNKQNYAKSLSYYQSAISNFPEFDLLYIKMGKCSYLLRNFEQSSQYYNKYFDISPFNLINIELLVESLNEANLKEQLQNRINDLIKMKKSYKPFMDSEKTKIIDYLISRYSIN